MSKHRSRSPGTHGRQHVFQVWGFALIVAAVGAMLPTRVALAGDADTPGVFVLGDKGLAAVTIGGENRLAQAAPVVRAVQFVDTPWNPNELDPTAHNKEQPELDPYSGWRPETTAGGTKPTATRYDSKRSELIQTYPWGELAVRYKANGDFAVRIGNTSDKVLNSIRADLFAFHLPKATKPRRVMRGGSGVHMNHDWNLEGPRVVYMDADAGRAVLFGRRFDGAYRNAFVRQGKGKDSRAIVRLEVGGFDEVYDTLWNTRPIPAGESLTLELGLRLGSTETSAHQLAAPAYKAFAKQHPMTLNWPDRRPIANIMVASAHIRSKTNPRAWFHIASPPKGADLRTEEGRKAFGEQLLERTDQIIKTCREQGVSGVVVWNISGEQFPPAVYYGEPRIIEKIAPEMNAVVDEFFARLRRGGLRVGVCIRPQLLFARDADKKLVPFDKIETIYARNWVNQIPEIYRDIYDPKEARSTLERLSAKIAYAKQRWGCTLFYIDANYFWRPRNRSADNWGWKGMIIPANVFQELHRRHPDVLLMPEVQSFATYTCSAPLDVPPHEGRTTHPAVWLAYPQACGALLMTKMAQKDLKDVSPYVWAVNKGDMMMPPGWYGGRKKNIQQIYGQATQDIAHRVTLSAKGAVQLDGRPLDDLSALAAAMAKATDNGGAEWPQRRVVIRHHPDLPGMAMKNAVDAVTKAGGIVVWAQPDRHEQ